MSFGKSGRCLQVFAVVLTTVLVAGLICSGASHEPIRISSNEELAEENGLEGGSGTENDPYIIKGWGIDASDSDYGLRLKDLDAHILITRMKISGAETANLSLKNVSNITIKQCVLSNSVNGLEVIDGKNVELIRNKVTSNKFGISLVNGIRNKVEHNLIKSNKFGIYLEGTELNEIAYNQVEENSWNGVYVDSSSRTNTFHHNNFIDNQVAPVRAENQLNNWNGKQAGNYWNDYTGKDEDGDGLGDTAFEIPSSHTKVYDYKPLIEPWADTYSDS